MGTKEYYLTRVFGIGDDVIMMSLFTTYGEREDTQGE